MSRWADVWSQNRNKCFWFCTMLTKASAWDVPTDDYKKAMLYIKYTFDDTFWKWLPSNKACTLMRLRAWKNIKNPYITAFPFNHLMSPEVTSSKVRRFAVGNCAPKKGASQQSKWNSNLFFLFSFNIWFFARF